jgi:methionyl-tRNA synthetase
MKKNIFIGVAWPYANNDLHIGHLVGCYFGADIFARFQRLIGNNVLMVSGSDCSGTPVCLKAEEEGISPEKTAEKYHSNHHRCFEKAEIIFDNYTTTTTALHQEVVHNFFLKLFEQGYIFKKFSQQFFSETEQRFLPDTYIIGTCPICQSTNAKSNQCDQCGAIDLGEKLIKPKNKINNNPLSLKETEHYFLDWPKLQPLLERYFKQKSKQWRKWIKNETNGWLKKDLEPRAITRDIEYGVKLPIQKITKDKLLKNIEGKRIYVWFEAVIGYLSASIEWGEKNKKEWRDFWYDNSNKIEQYYFMGKDNLVFHTLFWPGQLLVYDKKIHLPDKPIINHYLTNKGEKLSKSQGELIGAEKMLDAYGAETIRFYAVNIMPENSDSNFSWEDFKDRHNNVLIGNFGNFVNRTLSLAKGLNFTETIPSIEEKVRQINEEQFKKARGYLNEVSLRNYIEEVLKLSDKANKYLEQKQPWRQKKEAPEAFLKTILNAVYFLINLTLLLKPVLPQTTLKIEEMMGITKVRLDKWPEEKRLNDFIVENITKIKIKEIVPLFKKIE